LNSSLNGRINFGAEKSVICVHVVGSYEQINVNRLKKLNSIK
jgi:hypothetical protein